MEEKNVKGRITVYSISGCPHCRSAKTKLKDLGLPFHEINLDVYPERRIEMLNKSGGKHTVPQIFFNNVHVGGNDSFQALPAEELERLIRMVTEIECPSDAPLPPQPTSSNQEFDLECEPDEYVQLLKELRDPKTGIEIKNRTYHLKSYKMCFVGKDAVTWMCTKFNIQRHEAVDILNRLFDKHFFHHVVKDHKFKDEYLFYRFLVDEESSALNTSSDGMCEPRAAGDLSKQLRRLILAIYDEFLSADGKAVDYDGIAGSEAFKRFKRMTCELQRVDLSGLNDDEKKAFFINIYNALVVHAYVEIGIPTSAWQRAKFFSTTSYIIAGNLYSLDDIEHGILRGNKKHGWSLSPPFKPSDPRYNVQVSKLDPRLHFALVCGAKGCPPIKTYSGEKVDAELETATQAFFQSGGIEINMNARTISLTMLLKWYGVDFGADMDERLIWIANHVSPEISANLVDLVKSKNYKLSFQTYDWNANKK